MDPKRPHGKHGRLGDHLTFDIPLADIVAVDPPSRSVTVLISRDLLLLEAMDLWRLLHDASTPGDTRGHTH
jgi:hypothetical protein